MPNGFIVIDKPAGWTSHDVVGKLRGMFRERRIGHGGTLDPMATGVLPVFVGRATRAADFLSAVEKRYTARMRLGVVTDTQDSTGTVLSSSAMLPSPEKVAEVLSAFRGELDQVPPMYSAVKVDGKKLYQLARQGVEVERKARRVTILELEVRPLEQGEYELEVLCTKGTYIRTLCHDIGQALGCGACMTALRRTAAGGFTEQEAVTMEQAADAAVQGTLEQLLLPVDLLFRDRPRAEVDETCQFKCRNGADFPTELPDGEYRVYGPDGFLALSRAAGGVMHTIKSFFEV